MRTDYEETKQTISKGEPERNSTRDRDFSINIVAGVGGTVAKLSTVKNV